ncbi:unnamed protein product [Amoebophrya sp. A25]|nr:unnamed protein product [Amoebophrya sp. A25]|eukprot:GSA25T00006551001.1
MRDVLWPEILYISLYSCIFGSSPFSPNARHFLGASAGSRQVFAPSSSKVYRHSCFREGGKRDMD